ncbi:MAG: cysteine dioxygenase family protein [Alteromonadaceae bacterium]|nr:cysteine dioxygenase family protein [Alteromonadaceae bacterium]
MDTSADTRQQTVNAALNRIRQTLTLQGLERSTLDTVLAELKQLAARQDLWNSTDFPPPSADERQARYLINQQEDKTFALYLNVMRPGKRIPPHNHTTWACIAAVEGEETNTLYRRLDDGSVPGKAELAIDHHITVGPGSGVALMPDDIHAVLIEGDTPIRHLHLYGHALETLNNRITFDVSSGTCQRMDVGVKTRQAGEH